MNVGAKKRNLTLLAGSAILLLGIAVREEIYFAFNWRQMTEILNQNHLSRLLMLPTNGRGQEDSIKQIQLLKSGNWKRFINAKQSQLLDEKISQLKEGLQRRDLLEKYQRDHDLSASNAAELETKRLAEKGKINASVTRYLLDAAPRMTKGDATYIGKEGYIEFYNENDGGYRYNHRCFRNGSVSVSDSIITKAVWEDEPDYTCSIEFSANGTPVSVIVRSLSNQGFVALRVNLTTNQKQERKEALPIHCKQNLDDKKQIITLLKREKITALEGEKRLAHLSTKATECH